MKVKISATSARTKARIRNEPQNMDRRTRSKIQALYLKSTKNICRIAEKYPVNQDTEPKIGLDPGLTEPVSRYVIA